MDEFQFSVLMSVYAKENASHFQLALESNIENQTVRPTEFILVCDGPLTDALNRVAECYQERYPDMFRVYRLESNVGLGEALHFGLDKCTCEIVARADSDDICSPNRFEKQLHYLYSHPEIDVVGSYVNEFDSDYRVPLRKKDVPLDHHAIAKMMKTRNPMNHMTVMFRKSSVCSAGSYQPLDYVEDYYLWIRAVHQGIKFANMPEYLVNARVGNGMETRRGNKKYIGSWKKLGRYMLENGMISRTEFAKNMLAIRVFVYMPSKARAFLYKKVLRKDVKSHQP